MDLLFWLILGVLSLVVLGLIIWIVVLLTKPKICPANDPTCGTFCKNNCSNYCPAQPTTPVYLYGFSGGTSFCTTSSAGVLVQADGNGNPSATGTYAQVLKATPSTTSAQRNLAQWYLVPGSTANSVYLRNVSSGQYLYGTNFTSTSATLTLTSTLSSATPFNLNYAPTKSNTFALTTNNNGIPYFINVNGAAATIAQLFADSTTAPSPQSLWVMVPATSSIGTGSCSS